MKSIRRNGKGWPYFCSLGQLGFMWDSKFNFCLLLTNWNAKQTTTRKFYLSTTRGRSITFLELCAQMSPPVHTNHVNIPSLASSSMLASTRHLIQIYTNIYLICVYLIYILICVYLCIYLICHFWEVLYISCSVGMLRILRLADSIKMILR